MTVSSFLGQLRRWWNNYLTDYQKQEILNSTKRDHEGNYLPNQSLDTIIILILNIIYLFIGDFTNIYEKVREKLINVRCKTI